VTKLEFFVPGKPQSQGSKTWMPNGFMREADAGLKPWRAAVISYAVTTMRTIGWDKQFGPVALSVTFFYARPKSHYGTGKNLGVLKPTAPAFNVGPYDLDKSVRGVGDALEQSGAIRNDSQIVKINAEKLYAHQPGTLVCLRPIGPEEALPL